MSTRIARLLHVPAKWWVHTYTHMHRCVHAHFPLPSNVSDKVHAMQTPKLKKKLKETWKFCPWTVPPLIYLPHFSQQWREILVYGEKYEKFARFFCLSQQCFYFQIISRAQSNRSVEDRIPGTGKLSNGYCCHQLKEWSVSPCSYCWGMERKTFQVL